MENAIVSKDKNKPALDEQALAKILEAAYILQEHNREVQELLRQPGFDLKAIPPEVEADLPASPLPPPPKPQDPEPATSSDYTFTLAQVVETQHQIQARRLKAGNAMSLVAEHVIEIIGAGGAAVGLVIGGTVRYPASAGIRTLPAGTEVPVGKALCAPCLQTGEIVRCAKVDRESILNFEECHSRGIHSLIAVPVFYKGAIAGGLELYYSDPNAFTEQDVHTCILMSGLITEALERDEEFTPTKSPAPQHDEMLETLEELQPDLAALVERSADIDTSARTHDTQAEWASAFSCRKCGHSLVAEEQYCGQCGHPRSTDYEPPSLQKKVALLWQMQEAKKAASSGAPGSKLGAEQSLEIPARNHFEESSTDLIESPGLEPFAGSTTRSGKVTGFTEEHAAEASPTDDDAAEPGFELPAKAREHETVALAKPPGPVDWTSAASAREFLEQLVLAKSGGALARFWNARRGDIYLAIAVLLVAFVLRWEMSSNPSASATATPATPNTASAASHSKPAPEPSLSLFDRMLVQMGLADPPEVPEDKGNPSIQVWVDLHSALYYCPGADLYGKTSKGKFATQRSAQLDQYQPAYRKPCN